MQENKYDTIVVNLLAGASAGKSTIAYLLAGLLKTKGIECEYVSEWIKEPVYDNRKDLFQMYITSKQLKKLKAAYGKVQVLIVDSPILLGIIHDEEHDENFKQFILKEFNKFDNLNLFVNREGVPFSSIGRNENSLEEAIEWDNKLKDFLNKNNIPFTYIKGGLDNCIKIADKIGNMLDYLKRNKNNIYTNICLFENYDKIHNKLDVGIFDNEYLKKEK